MDVRAVLDRLEAEFASLVDELAEFLRIPSVSSDPDHTADVERCAAWLARALEDAGFRTAVEPTGGHPAVVAEWRGAPDAPTVLVYGHYDVQPAQPADGWTS